MSEPRPRAIPRVQVDNERVAVTEWSFQPGAETGWHRHAHDYVVVPSRDGRLKIELPDGSTATSELRSAQSYFRPAGVEHNVINDSGHDFSFVEIEVK